MPVIVRDYHAQLIQTMKDLARHNKWWSAPINLGGVSGPNGGSGVPIGGIFQQLIQQRVAYDTTEAAYSGIITRPPSGSLVDNLAHIRYNISGLDDRVTILEEIGILQVQDEGVLAVSGVTVLDFVGESVTATPSYPGKATITISGRPHAHIYNELISGIPAPSGFTYATTRPFLPATLRIYFNGLRQSPTYFTEFPFSGFTTTFETESQDELLVDYDTRSFYSWGDGWGDIYWGGG